MPAVFNRRVTRDLTPRTPNVNPGDPTYNQQVKDFASTAAIQQASNAIQSAIVTTVASAAFTPAVGKALGADFKDLNKPVVSMNDLTDVSPGRPGPRQTNVQIADTYVPNFTAGTPSAAGNASVALDNSQSFNTSQVVKPTRAMSAAAINKNGGKSSTDVGFVEWLFTSLFKLLGL